MTRSQAAQRLLALRNLRDAKDACEMGARALMDLPFLVACAGGLVLLVGLCVGLLV